MQQGGIKYLIALPIDKQRAIRKGFLKNDSHTVFKGRLRPKLKKENRF